MGQMNQYSWNTLGMAVLVALGAQAVPVCAEEVVVYTSLDQEFSEPILRLFEQQTGITVKAVYDVEAAKTTGLVNRLVAEAPRPRCDVFWNSEIARTILLKHKGILAPYRSASAADIPPRFKDPQGYWTGFAARARVCLYNTHLLQPSQLPQSIFDFTQPAWRGKVAMAYPLFGTTATHVAAWYVSLGADTTQQLLRGLKANGVLIVDGNSTARDAVVDGTVPIAFTDTDDANVAIADGKPVAMVFPDQQRFGTLLIPNTVALIKDGPNPRAGMQLIDYLLSRDTERRLAQSASAQIPLRPGIPASPHTPDITTLTIMQVDYEQVAQQMDEAAEFSRELFVR